MVFIQYGSRNFFTVRYITNSSTRQQNCLYVPKTKTDAGATSMDVLGPKMSYNLPPDITKCASFPSFKSRLPLILDINDMIYYFEKFYFIL